MTKRVELGDFVEAFIGEAEDLLRTLSAKLLATEADLRAGRQNPRAVRDAFRATHTLKGLAAMVGVEPIVAIAHRMESLLRAADDAGGTTTLPAMDLLLRGARELDRRLESVANGKPAQPPPAELIEGLDALDRPEAQRDRGTATRLELDPSIAAKLGALEHEQIARAIADGRRVVRADFTPSPARSEAGLNITSVRERLSRVAEIVKVVPRSVPASEDAPGGLSFALILVPTGTDEEVADAAGVASNELLTLSGGEGARAEPDMPGALPLDAFDEDEEGGRTQRANVVRVEVSRLDDAMERLSALVVARFRMAKAVAQLVERGVDVREVSALLAENGRQLRDMRAAILRVRMVPVAEILERIPLLVRGLRRATGKHVKVMMDAGRAELDKAVAERLFPAIVHLVRNAVDHAIESPDERRAAGKPEEGTLTISCFERSSTQLELTVADDGAGIDRERIAARAGVPVPESDAALLAMLCRPGLSTRAEATTTSGRGMGMDIVKRIAVDELGGEMQLRTRAGHGSAFTLRVPLTISIVESFTFEAGGQRFVVPVSTVEEILELDRTRAVRGPAPDRRERVSLVERRGEVVPVLDLEALFSLPRADPPPGKALLVRRGGEPIAFAVDRMLGQQEVVLRPLEDPLVKRVGIAGATDLGDGRPTLVLDLAALGGAALAGATTEPVG
ncbi:MAG TPA: chemotaxis protein CheW [Anaeromyxobacteraceae bacterium]|nr:chemotaxis protein CheW [Anaeromyxobacteraceae bacterium]